MLHTYKSILLNWNGRTLTTDEVVALLTSEILNSPYLPVANFALFDDVGGCSVLEGVVLGAGSSS